MVYSCGMKKPALSFSLLLLIIGSFFLSLSVFAEAIGLDRNPGNWSRARIAVFIVGGVFVLLAYIHDRFNQKIHEATSRVWTSVQRNPVAVWLSKRTFFQLASKYLFTLPIPIVVLFIYIFLASSGTWTKWVSPTGYYASLANGFKSGTLAVEQKPSPQLIALENPYDMASWSPNTHIPTDMSYYKGSYYLYWGPVPALIIFLLKPIYTGRIGDLQITFLSVYGIFLCLHIFIISLRDRFFSNIPKWTLQISLLLAGLASPFTFMLANYKGGRIYEAAIASGQFFLLTGFLFIFFALGRSRTSTNAKLFIGGFLWALAFGSRVILVVPIGFMILVILYWLYTEKIKMASIVAKLFWLCLPLAIGAAGIGWYNWARFGSITETGVYYNFLTDGYMKDYKDWIVFHPIYIPQNLFNNLLNPFKTSAEFPFLFPEYALDPPLFPFYRLPEIYTGQWITGLIWAVPFILFAVVPLASFIKMRHELQQLQDNERVLRWAILFIAVGFFGAFALLMLFYWAALRYQADFTPFLLLLSVIGFWQGWQFLEQKPKAKKLYAIVSVGLASTSIIVSTLLALAVNDARFILLGFFQ